MNSNYPATQCSCLENQIMNGPQESNSYYLLYFISKPIISFNCHQKVRLRFMYLFAKAMSRMIIEHDPHTLVLESDFNTLSITNRFHSFQSVPNFVSSIPRTLL